MMPKTWRGLLMFSPMTIGAPTVAPTSAVVTRAESEQPWKTIRRPVVGVQSATGVVPVKVWLMSLMADGVVSPGVLDISASHGWRPGHRRGLVLEVLASGRAGGTLGP